MLCDYFQILPPSFGLIYHTQIIHQEKLHQLFWGSYQKTIKLSSQNAICHWDYISPCSLTIEHAHLEVYRVSTAIWATMQLVAFVIWLAGGQIRKTVWLGKCSWVSILDRLSRISRKTNFKTSVKRRPTTSCCNEGQQWETTLSHG